MAGQEFVGLKDENSRNKDVEIDVWATKTYRIRTKVIRDKVGVVSMIDKMTKVRLRWFGHEKRRCIDNLIRRCERLAIMDIKRGRGRPEEVSRRGD